MSQVFAYEESQYYSLEVKFTNGKISRFTATPEIISDLYERAYKECGREIHGTVQAIAAPVPFTGDLISRDQKLMILGAGRSGTTFLVKLLTRLGFYTGYDPYNEIDYGPTRAGCEFGIFSFGEINHHFKPGLERFDESHMQDVYEEFTNGPFVIKSPTYSWYTKMIVFHYKIPFGHIILPVRDHREVATSRIKEHLRLSIIGQDHESQVLACDVLLGRVVETAVLADIPMTFICFPDIVMSEEYCWNKLDSVLSGTFDIHLDRERFREDFEKLADPSMIKHSVRKLV